MAGPPQADGLGRWLLGGLAVGAVALGLMVVAYSVGYNRGQDSVRTGSSATPGTTTTSTSPTGSTTETSGTTTAGTGTGTIGTTTAPTAAGEVALGKQLFTSDGCSGCHSLDGTAGAGPTMKGLAGSKVTLSDGTTVTADDAYLATAITDPDAQIVQGHQKGIMSGAIASFGLAEKQPDVDALVAFIKTQR